MNMINVFIGYDPKETVAFYVLAQSIISRASQPVSIVPVCLAQLRHIYQRSEHELQSTEFSFSRFFVPYLSEYSGWSLFMDCDMLVLDDIAKLWSCRDENYAVQVIKHEHEPTERTKFLGQVQTKYEKKNWSSVMLFNNSQCKSLTPQYVNEATGLELHQFKWLDSEELIGELPKKWNHLVGYDSYKEDVSNLHFTIGGPYFAEYKDCEYADLWFEEKSKMLYVKDN